MSQALITAIGVASICLASLLVGSVCYAIVTIADAHEAEVNGYRVRNEAEAELIRGQAEELSKKNRYYRK